MVSSGGDRCELGTRSTQIAESYVGGGDMVVVVVGTREIVMLTALPIFTWIPAAGCWYMHNPGLKFGVSWLITLALSPYWASLAFAWAWVSPIVATAGTMIVVGAGALLTSTVTELEGYIYSDWRHESG